MHYSRRKFDAFMGEVLRLLVECLASRGDDVDAVNQVESVLKT
jgi:hypothetical protein